MAPDDTHPTGNAHSPPPPPPPRHGSPPPPPPYYGPAPEQRRPRGRWLKRIGVGFLVALLSLSVLINIYLAVLVAVLSADPLQSEVVREGDKGQQVAVFYIDAMIDEDMGELFDAFTRTVLEDDGIRAAVVRVDSPGGGVSASDWIHNGIREIRDAGKPVVISMGSMATSGGYYVSVPARHIFAEPSTITGSIGAVIMYPVFKNTLDKIGTEVLIIRSTAAEEWKARPNPFEQPTERELDNLRELLDTMHARFVQVIADGRTGLDVAAVEELATGQVWMAERALELGLIDEVGYLRDAIDHAVGLATLDRPHVVRYRPRVGLFGQVGLGGPSVRIDANLIRDLQAPRILLIWPGPQ